MLLDREITPELERELIRQQVVIAHSREEVLDKSEGIEGNIGVRPDMAARALDYILRKWKGVDTPWSALKGLRVLDLASGSAYNSDTFGAWYPHFSRFCAINGADVVAIDAKPQQGLDETMFTWVAADLVNVVLGKGLNSLPVLQGKEFDIVHSSAFVGFNFSPQLAAQLARRGTRVNEFEKVFLHQAGGLLVEGGVMFLDNRGKRRLPVLYTRKGQGVAQLP